ncbi:hypothetical protein BS47DRAFT_1486654 [Hydnum rufescens UP504]|uniref:BTB domain-containing protein n=1 Tax=Hydnum rufescens UP504 TaxID=1448309 RepID=A0A9P6AUU8_9AGAM|nr:hypothetical protein BS47DRAFT_1486654 [Hydnum rufescens UP504]
MATATTTTRHEKFYFDEPETLIFEVGGVLFRPHIFLLRRYSEFFRDILSPDSERKLGGYDDSLPIVLADVRLADHPEITAEEFELALSVMYPEVLIKNRQKTSAQWCKVLDVAKWWKSPLLRDAAITQLAKSDLHASMRLAISTKYDVPEWLPDILPNCAFREFRNQLVLTVSAVERCERKSCAWSHALREKLCDYLRASISSTPDLGRPDHSSFTKVFETFATTCRDCALRGDTMLSTCEDLGRSLVRKRCFPKKKKNSRRQGVQ